MFYQTKVLDAYGNQKKIISGEELSRRHWENFKILEESGNPFAKNLQKGTSKYGRKRTILKGSEEEIN